MIRPTRRAVFWAGIGLAIALLPAVGPAELWPVWVAYNGLLLLALGADGILGLSRRRVSVSVDHPKMLYIGDSAELTVTVEAEDWQGRTPVEVVCDLEGEVDPVASGEAVLDDTGQGSVRFVLEPKRRGQVNVPRIWLRWAGPLGLASRVRVEDVAREMAVIPNVRAVRNAALRLLNSHDFLSGLKNLRYIGDGSEFESLREYIPGFDPRAIDWRTSARHRKLYVREYQLETNHRVMLALDAGYLMSQPLEGIPRVDHAINAGMLLAYLSLKMGDKVGVMSFDDRVRSFMQPVQGIQSFSRLQHEVSQVEYRQAESNFTLALSELAARLRRRSIMVVLTDFTDTVSAELMVENMTRLARRHLVIFVAIRDPDLSATANAEPEALLDVHRAVAASDFERDRQVVMQRLRRQGILCVDARPREITVELINQYLKVKRRGML